MPVILLLIFLPKIIFAQADQIILPELDLTIEDQSTLNTVNAEIAVLRDRSPEFQEVYLEEISGGLEDASLSKALSQKNTVKQSFRTVNCSQSSWPETKYSISTFSGFTETQAGCSVSPALSTLFDEISWSV